MTPSVSYKQFFGYLLLASLIAWGGVEKIDRVKHQIITNGEKP